MEHPAKFQLKNKSQIVANFFNHKNQEPGHSEGGDPHSKTLVLQHQ